MPNTVVTAKPHAYALFANKTGKSWVNIDVKGGGGVLLVRAAKGSTCLTNCNQLEASSDYGFYIGGTSIKKVNDAGICTHYSEDFTDDVSLSKCNGKYGSKWAALFRAMAFRTIHLQACEWSDTDAQSAPGAVRNAVCRAHHGKEINLLKMTLWGDVNFGPMIGYSAAGPPNGEELKFRQKERLDLLTLEDCDIHIGPKGFFTLAPGIKQFHLLNCRIHASTQAVIQTPWPYLNRPKITGTIENCILSSTYKAKPLQYFSEKDGSENITLKNTKLVKE